MNDWLKKQKAYQENVYGTDIDGMITDYEARTEYVTWNLHALMLEAAEAGEETPWKPWSSRDKKEAWDKNRDAYVGELIDIAFFLANAAIAAQVTDEEWVDRYEQKRSVNEHRQATNYNAHSTKCPNCKRELDKPGAYITHTFSHDNPSDTFVIFQLECNACRSRFDFKVEEGGTLPGTKPA